MQEILGPMRRCIEDYDMIRDGEMIAVGVSGGKDSLVLLAALARLKMFYPKRFELLALTLDGGVPGMDFTPIADYCKSIGAEYVRVEAPIYEVVFEARQESNPCSLCAKLRRGALNTAITERGIKKLALGHHFDDAVETYMMNLFFEGRIGCFRPVTYLSRMDVTQIRPLLYAKEKQVRAAADRLNLPVVHNNCPMDGASRRQEVKDLIAELEKKYPDLKQKIFGAMQRYPIEGWKMPEAPPVAE